MEQQLLNKKQVAKLFGKTTRTVDRWIAAGVIKIDLVEKNHRRFSPDQIDKLLKTMNH